MLLRFGFLLGIIFFLIGCLKTKSFGQKNKNKVIELQEYFPSENIDASIDFNTPRNRPTNYSINLITKFKIKDIYYGNPCSVIQTRKMGFEYTVDSYKMNRGNILTIKTQNFLTHIKLLFTRGPLWKVKVKRAMDHCRRTSGDIVG